MSNELNYDDISCFFNYSVLIPSRTIYLGSTEYEDGQEAGVNFRLAERITKSIITLNAFNTKEPIAMVINNIGGDEYHGLAIYDAIKTSCAPIDVLILGSAMSMGAVISQAGRKRIMSRNSTMMWHYGATSMSTESQNVKPWAKETERLNGLMEGIILHSMRSKDKTMTHKKVKEFIKTDKLLTAKQALKLGFIDEII
jgi:ATP-dependent Clp protease protease subunit